MKKLLLSLSVIFMFVVYSLNDKSISADPNSSTVTIPSSGNPAGKGYNDGSYTGEIADAFYGNVQVRVIIQKGSIKDVQFLQYPNDRLRSLMISNFAMPQLKQEVIQVQSANVDIVSGATDTSQAFMQSLGSALAKAK